MRIILSPSDCVHISRTEFHLILKELPEYDRIQNSHKEARYEQDGNTFAFEFEDYALIHHAYMKLR